MPDDLISRAEEGPPRAGVWPLSALRRLASWRILVRTIHEFNDDRIMAVAAGVTFYALLAIFPAIAALISIWGLFADRATVTQELATLSGMVPGGMMTVIGDELKRLAAQNSGTLGLGFFGGLAISLWFASSGVKALFDALNVVCDETERRGFLKLSAIALLFTLGWLVVGVLALGAVLVLPILFDGVGLGGSTGGLIAILRWPAMTVIVIVGLAFLYRYGPDRRQPQLRWITWGNVVAALLWLGSSLLFTWYVANFGSYDKTYGSLGAVAGFMTWIWLSTMVILLGAELDCEIERQRVGARNAAGGT